MKKFEKLAKNVLNWTPKFWLSWTWIILQSTFSQFLVIFRSVFMSIFGQFATKNPKNFSVCQWQEILNQHVVNYSAKFKGVFAQLAMMGLNNRLSPARRFWLVSSILLHRRFCNTWRILNLFFNYFHYWKYQNKNSRTRNFKSIFQIGQTIQISYHSGMTPQIFISSSEIRAIFATRSKRQKWIWISRRSAGWRVG